MAIIKCKMCGGDLALTPGSNLAVCQYCGSQQTVPTIDDDKKARLYNRANQYRLECEFDKAYTAYESIVNDQPDEAEAYWGMLLSDGLRQEQASDSLLQGHRRLRYAQGVCQAPGTGHGQGGCYAGSSAGY